MATFLSQHDMQLIAYGLHTTAQLDMQATECQFIGEWVDGVFVSGTWALQDGSLYKGQFGNKVHNNGFHAHMSCDAVLPKQICKL